MGSTSSKVALIAALTTLWPTIASPQQGGLGTGGLQVDVGVDTGLKYDSNFDLTPGSSPGDSYISDTKLTFGLTSVTSAYDFSLGASTVLRFADLPGRSVSGFEDPTIRLRFVADSVNSRLTLTGRYRNVDRDFLDPFEVEREEQLLGTLVGDGGTLIQTNLGLKYETGLAAPLGLTLDLNHSDKDYENVSDPLLFPETTDSVRGTVSMRLSPVATARVFAGRTEYEAEDTVQTERTTTDYGVGVTYEVSPVLLLDADIGQTTVDTNRTSGFTTRDGLSGSITLTRSLINGTVFGTLDSSVDQNGQRTSLSFGRDMQLRSGNLLASLGLTEGDVGGTDWIARVRYDHQMRNSTLTFTLDRDATTNALDQETIDTRLFISYLYDINSLSRLRLSLDFGREEDTGGTGARTIDLTNLSASYSRDLTQDWALTGGVVLRSRKDTGQADADSTAVFLSLDRTFSFRP